MIYKSGKKYTWKYNDYLCKNHILNGLADDLYDYYNISETDKHIWEALEIKYDTKELEQRSVS